MSFKTFLLNEQDPMGGAPPMGDPMGGAPPMGDPMGGGMGGAPPMGDPMGGGMGAPPMGGEQEPPPIPHNADVWDVLDAILNQKPLEQEEKMQQQQQQQAAAPPDPMGGMGGDPMAGGMPDPMGGMGGGMDPAAGGASQMGGPHLMQ